MGAHAVATVWCGTTISRSMAEPRLALHVQLLPQVRLPLPLGPPLLPHTLLLPRPLLHQPPQLPQPLPQPILQPLPLQLPQLPRLPPQAYQNRSASLGGLPPTEVCTLLSQHTTDMEYLGHLHG